MLALLALLWMSNQAATIENGSNWSDGFVMLHVTEVHEGCATLMGGTLHEGGYQVCLVPTGVESEYRLAPVPGDDGQYCYFGGTASNGDRVTMETVDGIQLLVSRNHEGTVTHVFQELQGSLRDLMLRDLHMAYAGEYLDNHGKQWTFTLDGRLQRPGTSSPEPYTILDIFEMPSEVMQTAQGDYLMIKLSTTGLNVYSCTWDEENEHYGDQEPELAAKLRRTGSPWNSSGVCPYTQNVLITGTMASRFDTAMLRKIRNEVWARHGYAFSSADLRDYFSQQPWYTPNPNGNQSIKLSPIEQMNVDILRSVEIEPQRDWLVTEEGF